MLSKITAIKICHNEVWECSALNSKDQGTTVYINPNMVVSLVAGVLADGEPITTITMANKAMYVVRGVKAMV